MNLTDFTLTFQNIYATVPSDRQPQFMSVYLQQQKNPTVAFGLSVFLGFLGVDRLYVGDLVLGLLKFITGGGFGIWYVVDLFLIAGCAREKNIQQARQIAAYFQQGNGQSGYTR